MLRPRGERGSTLLDAVVGTALMLVVFVGFVGAFRLTVMAVSNNKARAGAIALANERLEFVRSLPYDSVGTTGGIPSGEIAQEETVELNDVQYTRRTFIAWEDDPADGAGGADENSIITDYKSAKVTVSWIVRDGEHTITLISRLSPPGIETSVPGGILSFNVINAALLPVSNAQIRILNTTVSPTVDMTTYTDADGTANVLGVPAGSDYRISVSKSGYSTAQTYSSSATNTNPIPTHLGVALNQTTAATFAIDVLGSITIETFSPITTGSAVESFVDSSGIASTSEVIIGGGTAVLAVDGEGAYISPGTFMTEAFSTTTLSAWSALAWDADTPAGTNVLFRVYDAAGAALVPDSQIPGNSSGLSASPVDLSAVSTTTYSAITIHATLTTNDPFETPVINSVSVAMDTGPLSLSDIDLMMTGAKTIGSTGGGALVYKYQNSSINSGSPGSVTLDGMEWDSYTIALTATSTYAIVSACGPQPEALAPGGSQTTRLYLAPATTNSLLVDVKNAMGATIPDASVRLYRTSPTYDTNITADDCGQSFFSNLGAGTGASSYSLDVSASGYQPHTSTDINVSGQSRASIILDTN